MRLTRSPYREVLFLVVSLFVAFVWMSMRPASPKWVLLLVVGVAGLAVHVALRMRGARSFPRVPDQDFLHRCGMDVAHARAADALAIRREVAQALSLPRECVAPELRLRELMAATAWFGSDLLALADVQRCFEKLSGQKAEVKPDVTVAELVQRTVAGRGGA